MIYIIITIITAIMAAGIVAIVSKAGEKDNICKYGNSEDNDK